MDSFYRLLAICTLAAWPVIPLFWIPVHLFHYKGKRRAGRLVYVLIALAWLPCLWAVLKSGDLLLSVCFHLPLFIKGTGWIMFMSGIALQTWTALVMGKTIIGIPEVTETGESPHVTTPPFNWCRHPTYLSHSLMFFGAAILTGYAALFVLAALDFIITYFIIIPLEERELIKRLGKSYEHYMNETPKFFIKIRKP